MTAEYKPTLEQLAASYRAKLSRAASKGKALTVPRRMAEQTVLLLEARLAPPPKAEAVQAPPVSTHRQLTESRAEVFEILRRYGVDLNCFAEVAAVTYSRIAAAAELEGHGE